MTDLLERHPYCLPCALARLTGETDGHNECLGRLRIGYRWCSCLCPWLRKDTDEPVAT